MLVYYYLIAQRELINQKSSTRIYGVNYIDNSCLKENFRVFQEGGWDGGEYR